VSDALRPATGRHAVKNDTLSVRELDHLTEILSLAKENGLFGYSGVAGEPI
jgi:hypothetical protein